MSALILSVDNISLNRGERAILRDVSFRAETGDALVLTGQNGAGKTTLIRAIAGFIKPESGAIRLNGGDPEYSVGEQCHYVGHSSATKAGLTAQENLQFWCRYLAPEAPLSERRARVDDGLTYFGLSSLADVPAAIMSQGQRRRLGLARLFVAKRPVWLLDEPTVSLDDASTQALSQLFRDHVADGGIVLAATHLPLGITGAKTLRLAGGKADLI